MVDNPHKLKRCHMFVENAYYGKTIHPYHEHILQWKNIPWWFLG